MARTKGSGWGAGTIFYQRCPFCQKKKAMYDPLDLLPSFKCTSCKKRFDDKVLRRIKYVSQL